MAASVLNKIEYLVLLVAAFAAQSKISEAQAYRYLSQYGALALCEKHYSCKCSKPNGTHGTPVSKNEKTKIRAYAATRHFISKSSEKVD